ncbi:MAG: DUF1673 family protein [Methanosarcinales archaeon]|nr:DUF1673 family protein [Methanosarcinales archaeon]
MTINVVENVRKLMGWCPNMDSTNSGKTLHFDEVVVNAPDSGDKLTHTTGRWWNKYRNKILPGSLVVTPWAFHLFILYGADKPDIFLAGIITGLVVSLGTAVAEWRKLNEVAAGKYKNLNVSKKKMFINRLIVMVSILAVMLFMVHLIEKIGFNNFYAFFAGALLFIWVPYFTVIYWERKNQKILIMEKTSFYAVDAKTMGSVQ